MNELLLTRQPISTRLLGRIVISKGLRPTGLSKNLRTGPSRRSMTSWMMGSGKLQKWEKCEDENIELLH